jgi:hypothetical protein
VVVSQKSGTNFCHTSAERRISWNLGVCGETYSDGKTSKGDTGAGSRGLVHLTEDKGDLGLALEVDDTSLLHLVVQVVTLTGTLADTAEHGVTTVSLGDVVLEMR